ncbi:mycothiol synthase [Nonomuraea solani]|uniref:Mycothiol synthase n=1 Tax=Nonomuraea solani TaxID=1144553 RepID=A0A1H6CXA4_9ACTN|nr:GNAT family N-acetyltransferase [Nonomuraea solani]SEG77484.1 mycothiol synthase [Nonomuraea solani]
MRWGPVTREDARPLADFWAALEAEDRTGEVHSLDDVTEQLAHPRIDLATGTLAAWEGDRIVALGYLPARQAADETHTMRLWGGVHPAHRRRGHGRRVVDWAIRTAPGLSERAFPGVPLELHLHVSDGNPGLAVLAESSGMTAVRTFARMERGLAGEPPTLRPPEGLEIATWTPELDDGARHVRNESFRDHWGSVPHTRESWRDHLIDSHNFRPESSFVALAGDQAVGVLITHDFGTPGLRQAWIQVIGTLKEWRGRGVAGALVAHALAAFKEQGYESAGLGVDTENPTGAVSVYTRAGFAISRRSRTYALYLPQREARDESGAGVHE